MPRFPDALLYGITAISLLLFLFYFWKCSILNKMAYIDKLTGVFNRCALENKLRRVIKKASWEKPMALIFLDIDHFKQINDTYGHEKGDEILKKVAEKMSKKVRSSDIVGRYGGEEFVLILPNTNCHKAEEISKRIQKACDEIKDEINIPVTVSIGIAIYPQEAENCRELVQLADQAMYQAKKQGRNRICGCNCKCA